MLPTMRTSALLSMPNTCIMSGPFGRSTRKKRRESSRIQGVTLSGYDGPRVSFDSERREWFVFFVGKPVNGTYTEGNHFAVVVDDSNEQTRWVPGR